MNIGNGYILLRPRDRSAVQLEGFERNAINNILNITNVRRWGRLRLANGQVARSLFSEQRRMTGDQRISRNVKILLDGVIRFAEVQYYVSVLNEENVPQHCALVSLYGLPNEELLEASFNTLRACEYKGQNDLQVIPLSSIITVVSMQPLPCLINDPENLWYVIEKSGLDDINQNFFDNGEDI